MYTCIIYLTRSKTKLHCLCVQCTCIYVLSVKNTRLVYNKYCIFKHTCSCWWATEVTCGLIRQSYQMAKNIQTNTIPEAKLKRLKQVAGIYQIIWGHQLYITTVHELYIHTCTCIVYSTYSVYKYMYVHVHAHVRTVHQDICTYMYMF